MNEKTEQKTSSDLLCCANCGKKLHSDKFKDVCCLDGWYFTVYLTACSSCGYVDNDKTWVG